MSALFLETPRDIRAQLTALLRRARSLDMAVAFVGSDWQEILRELPTRTRLVCWLSSTNTNPYAIEQMSDAGVNVRQLDAMHAKVYVVPGAGAIVGSANLSISALSDAPVSLQYESAVRLGPGELSPVTAWFNWLWARARSVTPGDLAAAKRAWEVARRARRHGGRGQPPPRSTALPVNWHAPAALMDLARRVRQQRAWKHIADKHRLMSSLRPDRMSKTDLANLIETVAEWTGHIGAYAPARLVPLRHVREAFAYAFDDDEDIELRLKQLASGGT